MRVLSSNTTFGSRRDKDRKPKSAPKNHKAITTSQKPQKEAIEVLSNVKFKEKSNIFFRISSCHNFLLFPHKSLYRALNAKIRHTDQFIWSNPRNFCDHLKGQRKFRTIQGHVDVRTKNHFCNKKVKRRQNKELQRSVKTACKSENHEKTTKIRLIRSIMRTKHLTA